MIDQYSAKYKIDSVEFECLTLGALPPTFQGEVVFFCPFVQRFWLLLFIYELIFLDSSHQLNCPRLLGDVVHIRMLDLGSLFTSCLGRHYTRIQFLPSKTRSLQLFVNCWSKLRDIHV